jgi:hypothetical protein
MMTAEEKKQFESELQEQDEAGFQKGAALSKAGNYDALFAALEAESIDTLKYCHEEMAFWSRVCRREKDKVKKYLYGANVNDFKDKIEDTHHAIIERRELRQEFSRVSGQG